MVVYRRESLRMDGGYLVHEVFLSLGRDRARAPFLQIWWAPRGGSKWWARCSFLKRPHPTMTDGYAWVVAFGPVTVWYCDRRRA